MRLSIILPTLNEAEGIAAALAPLQPLRRAGHEVIVADGGSADGTPALAAPLADRVIAAPRGRAPGSHTRAARWSWVHLASAYLGSADPRHAPYPCA